MGSLNFLYNRTNLAGYKGILAGYRVSLKCPYNRPKTTLLNGRIWLVNYSFMAGYRGIFAGYRGSLKMPL